MNLPYALRVLCVCLASFLMIHLVLAVAARVVAGFVIRSAGTHNARSAAALLLGVRLLPAVFTIAIVASVCLPSFVYFEPQRGPEDAALSFLLASALGACVWFLSLTRSVRALVRTQRCVRRCASRLALTSQPVWLWEGPQSFIGLAGVFRPRMLISRSIIEALNTDQLDAALRHEQAHHDSRDNLKRLLLALAPDPLPGIRLFRAVDSAWSRLAELAADDAAVAGDLRCSVTLAEALVRVARLSAVPQPSIVVSSFLPARDDIAMRVNRLLSARVTTPLPSDGSGYTLAAILVLLLLGALNGPASLIAMHTLLERLMH
jgi:Zn-dependent protease with chaperone function